MLTELNKKNIIIEVRRKLQLQEDCQVKSDLAWLIGSRICRTGTKMCDQLLPVVRRIKDQAFQDI